MEEPKGFSIRYVWTAQVDGPALQTGVKSREYLTPYRPIIVSTPGKVLCAHSLADGLTARKKDRQWEYRKTLMRDRKIAAADIIATMLKQSYCPGKISDGRGFYVCGY